MGFVKGDIKINRNGRPKGPCIRTKITKRILESEGDTFAEVIADLGKIAKKGDKWAVEKYIHYLAPYILIKPKTEIDITGDEDMAVLTEVMTKLPTEKRARVGSLMTQLKEAIYGE